MVLSRKRLYLSPIAGEKGGRIRPTTQPRQQLPEKFPPNLSEMWYLLKAKLGGILEHDYYSDRGEENGMIANFTPEILLQEGHMKSPSALSNIVKSIKESTNGVTAEITIPREQVGYDPPVLIEVCDLISIDGWRTGDIPTAVREYSGQSIDPENQSYLIKHASPVKEVLAKHTGEEAHGVLFRQYGQDYDKNTIRESKRIPYKVFIAVLYVNKDGIPLQ